MLNSVLIPLLLCATSGAHTSVVVNADDPTMLAHQAIINAPVADVWEAWTTKEGAESWMVPNAEIDLRIGGLFKTSYDPTSTLDDDKTIEQTILSLVPQRMISMRCTKAPANFPFAEVISDTYAVVLFDQVAPDRTRIEVIGYGYTDHEQSKQMRSFFVRGNAMVLEMLQKRFDPDGSFATDDEQAMQLAEKLIGGEWIHESKNDEEVFRVRNIAREGPHGKSIITDGWLGTGEGMSPHMHSVIYRLPAIEGGGVGYFAVDDHGNSSRGVIRLMDNHTIVWHWPHRSADGSTTMYRSAMTFQGDDQYFMTTHMQRKDGSWVLFNDLEYERVERVPSRFRVSAEGEHG